MLEQSVFVWSLVFQLSLSLSSFSRLVKFFLLWRRHVLALKNVGNADWERLAWWGTLTERERKREVTSHVQFWGLGIHVQWFHAPQRDNVENYRKATGSVNVYQFTSNTDKSKMYFHFCFNFSFAFSNHVVNEWITAVKIHFGLSRQTGKAVFYYHRQTCALSAETETRIGMSTPTDGGLDSNFLFPENQSVVPSTCCQTAFEL